MKNFAAASAVLTLAFAAGASGSSCTVTLSQGSCFSDQTAASKLTNAELECAYEGTVEADGSTGRYKFSRAGKAGCSAITGLSANGDEYTDSSASANVVVNFMESENVRINGAECYGARFTPTSGTCPGVNQAPQVGFDTTSCKLAADADGQSGCAGDTAACLRSGEITQTSDGGFTFRSNVTTPDCSAFVFEGVRADPHADGVDTLTFVARSTNHSAAYPLIALKTQFKIFDASEIHAYYPQSSSGYCLSRLVIQPGGECLGFSAGALARPRVAALLLALLAAAASRVALLQ